jgi:hypothetical protein
MFLNSIFNFFEYNEIKKKEKNKKKIFYSLLLQKQYGKKEKS